MPGQETVVEATATTIQNAPDASVIESEVSKQLISAILGGGTTSTVALLLGVSLVSLLIVAFFYKRNESSANATIAELKAENRELSTKIDNLNVASEQKRETLRAEYNAKVQAERDRADREIQQVRAAAEAQQLQVINEYKQLVMQVTSSMQTTSQSLALLRDTLLGAAAGRSFTLTPNLQTQASEVSRAEHTS